MKNNSKLFAFNLAAKNDEASSVKGQWKVRDGVALAGCTRGRKITWPIAEPQHYNTMTGRADEGSFC